MTIDSPSSPIKDLLRQQELLKKEYEYEKEIYQQQTERIGIRKKINKGLCWYPIIIGRSRYNSLNQLTIEIERREDRETEHNFEYGRPVRFFRMDLNGKCHFFNHTCHVSYAEENRIVVVLPSEAALREIGSVNELGIQLYFDETSYKTMFMALKEVTEAKNNRLAELRNLFLGTGMAPRERDLFPIRFPWLNHSQEMAVNKVLRAKDVAIVHGPPGTGKTTTLVEAPIASSPGRSQFSEGLTSSGTSASLRGTGMYKSSHATGRNFPFLTLKPISTIPPGNTPRDEISREVSMHEEEKEAQSRDADEKRKITSR